jgi:hypothetical protein
MPTDPQRYYADLDVQARMLGLMGGASLKEASCVLITAEDASPDVRFAPGQLTISASAWTRVLHVGRSLWDRPSPAFTTKEVDYHLAADLTGQANHLGVTIEADIIKQKLPETNNGFNALNFGKTHKRVYSDLTSAHPIDLTRYQVANCYMGRAGLINSGGASAGESDLREAVKTAVINGSQSPDSSRVSRSRDRSSRSRVA